MSELKAIWATPWPAVVFFLVSVGVLAGRDSSCAVMVAMWALLAAWWGFARGVEFGRGESGGKSGL